MVKHVTAPILRTHTYNQPTHTSKHPLTIPTNIIAAASIQHIITEEVITGTIITTTTLFLVGVYTLTDIRLATKQILE